MPHSHDLPYLVHQLQVGVRNHQFDPPWHHPRFAGLPITLGT
jgi:hypothetical protein